jgi:hypothetical protein
LCVPVVDAAKLKSHRFLDVEESKVKERLRG